MKRILTVISALMFAGLLVLPALADDITPAELRKFDQSYLDRQPEVAAQLRQNPSLLRNPQYLRDHRDLESFLNSHPDVREEALENPGRFEHREQTYERHEDWRNEERHEHNRHCHHRRWRRGHWRHKLWHHGEF